MNQFCKRTIKFEKNLLPNNCNTIIISINAIMVIIEMAAVKLDVQINNVYPELENIFESRI